MVGPKIPRPVHAELEPLALEYPATGHVDASRSGSPTPFPTRTHFRPLIPVSGPPARWRPLRRVESANAAEPGTAHSLDRPAQLGGSRKRRVSRSGPELMYHSAGRSEKYRMKFSDLFERAGRPSVAGRVELMAPLAGTPSHPNTAGAAFRRRGIPDYGEIFPAR